MKEIINLTGSDKIFRTADGSTTLVKHSGITALSSHGSREQAAHGLIVEYTDYKVTVLKGNDHSPFPKIKKGTIIIVDNQTYTALYQTRPDIYRCGGVVNGVVESVYRESYVEG